MSLDIRDRILFTSTEKKNRYSNSYRPSREARREFHRRPGYRSRNKNYRNKKRVIKSAYRKKSKISKISDFILENFVYLFVLICFTVFAISMIVLYSVQVEIFIGVVIIAIIVFGSAFSDNNKYVPRVPIKNLRKGSYYQSSLTERNNSNVSENKLKNNRLKQKINSEEIQIDVDKIQELKKSNEKLSVDYSICSSCGSLLEKEDIFCNNCGLKLLNKG